MKHIHLFIASLLLCICCYPLHAKNRVIEQPPFCVRNSTSIEVSKVVMSDTATVLHIYAKYRPKNWIKIASGSYLKDNNGETYQLRSGIGITPDKEFWMPESGEAEFQLIFPPVAANATSIDFTEGEGIQDGFSIWGIQLKGKKLPELVLPKEIAVHPVDRSTTLPEPIIQYGEATVKGKLLDYGPGMLKEISLYPNEAFKGFEEATVVNVQPDGSFTSTFPVTGTTSIMAYVHETAIQFFIEPNKTSEIYINLREASRQQSKFHKDGKPYGAIVYINGPLAGIAEEWNQANIKTSLFGNYEDLLKKAEDMDIHAYKSYMLEQSNKLKQEIAKQPLSQATKQLLTLEAEQSYIDALQMAPSMLTQAYLKKNKLENEMGREYYMKIQQGMPKDYIPASCYKAFNVPQILITPSYVNSIRMAVYQKDAVTKALGTDKGCFFDVLKTATLYQGIKDFNPLTEAQKQEIKSLPDAYQQALLLADTKLMKTIEVNKKKDGFSINEAGEVSNEDLFASIISKFRGKVLLVDFWATWCGPCRMANKAIAPMKEELKDKDIVYLYITGETSPLKTWENMIPDIHGEHYRVTDAQWTYLRDAFKVEGVPTYLVIDPEGNIKFKQTGFPGVEKMKEELLKVVKQ